MRASAIVGLTVMIAACVDLHFTVEELPPPPELAVISRAQVDNALGSHFGMSHKVCAPPYTFGFPPNTIAFVCAADTPNERTYPLPFADLSQMTVLKQTSAYAVAYSIGPRGSTYNGSAVSYVSTHKCTDPPMQMWKCLFWTDEKDAQLFLAALKQVPRISRMNREVESRFAMCAAPVRQAELPERARAQQVLAEHYFDQKNLDRSLAAYEAGLEIEPCWADGWFNAAQMDAELGHYAGAAAYMEHFLRLEPNGKDAGAARDKVVIWKDEAANAAAKRPP